jgi:hypothetical protein
MNLKTFFVIGALAFAVVLQVSAARNQPSIAFGTATVSLGMTVEQVQERLSGAARSIKFLPDKVTALVYTNGEPDGTEGQITFSGGRVVYAQFQMRSVRNADELAQEIAGAVDSMETKNRDASNYSAHGTGGGFSQIIFDCGSRRFNIMTLQTLGSSDHTINVNIEVGQIVKK